MDIKMMLTTFFLVFLAELGDKTQFATFGLAGTCDSRLSVFLGSAGALVTSSFIAVLFGGAITRIVPQTYIKIGAGVFFIIVGIWTLFSASRSICA